MLFTLAGRHVCISKQLHLFSYELQCGLTDLANTQIPTNFSVEFPKKSVCVRLPLTPLQVFPSWIHLPLLGPTVTQLHTSLCPFASPLSSVCCNPRYYTLPVQIRSVGPLKSVCMEWNPPWVFPWRAWFVVLSEQSFRGFGYQSDTETLYKNAGLLQLKQ